MKCPQCDEETRALTTQTQTGFVKRKRRCEAPECRHEFHTYEVTLEDYKKPSAELLLEIKKALG